MKLKKIASLALAGVMAVSMLTACGEANNNDDTQKPTEPDVTPAAGYSDTFEGRLGSVAGSKISMSDSNELDSALKAAMDFAAHNHIAYNYDENLNKKVTFVKGATNDGNDLHQVAAELIKKADTDRESMNKDDESKVINVLKAESKYNKDVKYDKDNVDVVMMYVVNGGLSTEAAVMEVADELNTYIEQLDMSYDKYPDTGDSTSEVVYNYTGSVSADTITLDADHGKSMTFVAVEIVRHLGR